MNAPTPNADPNSATILFRALLWGFIHREFAPRQAEALAYVEYYRLTSRP